MKALLLLLLAAPAAAQNLRSGLSAPILPTVRFSPGFAAAAAAPLAKPLAAPTLAAPALPAPTPALLAPAVLPAAAPAPVQATLAGVQAAAAPALQALSAPSVSGAAAYGAGISLEAALTGRPAAAAVNAALPTARSAPAVSGVAYARGVTKAQRAVLTESLTRRKAGWFRGLAAMGVRLDGPEAPALKVTKAEALKAGTAFEVSWTQGRTGAGAFRVTVPAKDPAPEFRRLAAPAPADAKVVVLRFHGVSDAEVLAFLESKSLRVVSKGWGENPWTVAVTGRDRAAAVAKRLNGVGPVLSATAKAASFDAADQVLVAFVPGSPAAALAAAFRRHELTVLEKRQDGLWRLGAAKGRGTKALHSLEHDGSVLYARGAQASIPESNHAVLTLKPAGALILQGLLRRHGLTVLDDLGGRVYLVGGRLDAAALAAALAADPDAASAVAVGTLGDDAVEAAAAGTAAYKGRPWSSTEYNLNWAMGYDSLRRRGATAAQLKRYEELTAAAPMRGGGFNPWSGD